MRNFCFFLLFLLLVVRTTAQSGFSTITKLRSFPISDFTKDKTQAKVWTYADRWWSVLTTPEGTKLFRLDGAIWTPVYILANSKSAQADCLVSGNMVHILIYRGSGVPSYLFSLVYNPVSNIYMFWDQRRTASSLTMPSGAQTASLALDSKGRMWITSGDVSNVYAWYSDAPYNSFSSPITIASGITSKDRYVVTALPGKIGIFWSSQTTKRFGFKTHLDTDVPTTWSADEVPASQSAVDNVGNGMASGQLNIQAANDGKLYCVAKTRYDKTGYPEVILLVRRTTGKWDNVYPVTTYPTGSQPTILVSDDSKKIKVLYTAKEGGGDILYKESLTSAISFGSQFTLINSGGIPLDYSTASHQPYNYKTVIMVTNSSSTPIEAVSVRASDAASTDITAPTVLSISRQSPSTQLTNGSTLKYRAVFSESVNGVDISDFKLTPTGSAKGTISAVTATDMDGFEYDVTVSSVTGVGDLRLDLQSSTGITIKDASGNNMTKTFSSGQPYTIDQSIKTLANIIRGPYLQVTSGTGITVRWRTDIATDSKVVVGTTYGTYTISGTSSTSTTEHIVRVTGLKASTKYFYRFGTSANPVIGDAGNYFTTAPPTSTKQKIRVAAFGDAGHFDITQTNVFNSYLNNTTSDPADLMLILGDNAYEDGTDSEFTYNFFKPFEDPMLKNHPLFPTPGNHDYHTTLQSSREAPYFKSFTTPQAGECGGVSSGAPGYYSFNWGNIHFLSLDSYGTETSSNLRMSDTLSPQVVWVKKDLEANTLPWTIVFFHHPPFTKGTRNSDTEGELIAIRQNFIRILERYGVDIVLTGHSHVYERSYLLRNYYGTEAEFNLATDAVTTSSGKYDGSVNSCPFVTTTKKIKHGTVYVVSGAASSIEPDIDPSFPHDALPFSSLQGSMFFFEVENNRLDAKCFREDGTTIDQFSILKTVNKTNNISITQGSSVTIKATWPGLYKWSTGATTNSITVTPTANTTYTVTDGMGCLKDVFNITVTPAALTMNSGGAINETLNGNSIAQVFPNIVERGRSVTIRTSNNELMDGALLDENGSLIRSFKFNGTTSLETSKLPAGVYFIMVKNKDKVEKQRIVVTTN